MFPLGYWKKYPLFGGKLAHVTLGKVNQELRIRR